MKSLALCLILSSALASLPDLDRGLTPHFSAWLQANGYGSFKYERTDLVGGAYGGKSSAADTIKHRPVVFFHGNSDIAVGTNDLFTGFSKTIQYFLSKGYSKSELYITTWGPGRKDLAANQFHSADYLVYLRKFTEAVIAYTGASKIDVICHSMGVTLGRRVIKGGQVNAVSSPFNLGPSLSNKVESFIGIAGANYGLVSCYLLPVGFPTCNTLNGFYPGDTTGIIPRSKYLSEINSDTVKEGANVFSIFSTTDDLIGFGNIVYGRYTSLWPTVDESKTFSFEINCHMKLRDETADEQYNLVTNHSFLKHEFLA